MSRELSIQLIKRFFGMALVVTLIALAVPFLSVSFGAGEIPDHITLTWKEDPRTTQTITWRTNEAIISGQVQYIEENQAGLFPAAAKRAPATVKVLATNVGDMNIHSVTLSGLKPGTRYLYRVGNEDDWSEPHIFTTAGATVTAVKFLVFGDSQSINYHTWQDTLQQAYQANPDAAFFTNLGDLVDVGQDYTHWNGWFDGAKGVIDTIPAMPVTGNHETYTPEHKISRPVYFTAQFMLPANGPVGLKRQVYSFDYGDVHFVMLDSQVNEERGFMSDMLEWQQVWLERDLTASQKKWKLVFFHKPPYNNKTEGNDNIRQAFVPIFDKYHVDVVFTGHDHTYARTYPLYGGEIMDDTARGTIYVATGRSGTKTYQDTISRGWDAFFYNPAAEPNYLTVEVIGDLLMVKAFTQSGEIIDAWSIHKAGSQP